MDRSRRRCPKCNGDEVTRMHRPFWLRLVPMSKYYCCRDCGHRFVRFRRQQDIILDI
jgi:DNA-directed RNA polymerase subunit M/transcription elongation factor TFIIS